MKIADISNALAFTHTFQTKGGEATVDAMEFENDRYTLLIRFLGQNTPSPIPHNVFEKLVEYPIISLEKTAEELKTWKLLDPQAAKTYVRNNYGSIVGIPDSRRYEAMVHAIEQRVKAQRQQDAIENARVKCVFEYNALLDHMGDAVAKAWSKALIGVTTTDALGYNNLADCYRAVAKDESYPDGYEGVRHPTLEQLMEAVNRLSSHNPTAMHNIALALMGYTAQGWDAFPACRRAEVIEMINQQFVHIRPIVVVNMPWVPPSDNTTKEATGFTGFYNAWRTIRSKYLSGLKKYADSKDLHRSHVPPEIKKTIFVHALKLWLRDNT